MQPVTGPFPAVNDEMLRAPFGERDDEARVLRGNAVLRTLDD